MLFDDIDCDMCPADAKEFPSFAHAQVTVTNDIYSHLDQPDVFLFCPTEYCGSRATPSVSESQYLKHVGSDLHSNIDIMWTGKGGFDGLAVDTSTFPLVLCGSVIEVYLTELLLCLFQVQRSFRRRSQWRPLIR